MDILIIGSLNMDLIIDTPRMPSQGETILGGVFQTAPGGKGGNQAVAAALLLKRHGQRWRPSESRTHLFIVHKSNQPPKGKEDKNHAERPTMDAECSGFAHRAAAKP